MRRFHVHTLFGVGTVLLLLGILWQSITINRVQTENRLLEKIHPDLSADEVSAILESDRGNSETVQLAVASALASSGQLQQAERILNELSTTASSTYVKTAAKFNLGNAYLRQTSGDGATLSSQNIPLIELGKQHYRELLKEQADHWPARYNLARALLLVPEATDGDDSRKEPIKRVNVIVPGFETKDLP
ncbi:MAG: hypothetical protein AB8B63_24780 [Granulosicoccus sp.]